MSERLFGTVSPEERVFVAVDSIPDSSDDDFGGSLEDVLSELAIYSVPSLKFGIASVYSMYRGESPIELGADILKRPPGGNFFLDAKFHDTGSSVRRAMREMQKRVPQIALVTMTAVPYNEEAQRDLFRLTRGTDTTVVAVLTLTSAYRPRERALEEEAVRELQHILQVAIEERVERLAIVCHPTFVPRLRKVVACGCKELPVLFICPGITFDDAPDRVRPRDAAGFEADYIVMGQSLTGATSIGNAFKRAVAEFAAGR